MIYITDPVGNNSLSYHERKTLGSDTHLRLPEIQTITSIDDVQLGSEIVFEEIDHRGQLRSLTGLAALYQMGNMRIMDNHNYALYARSQSSFCKGGGPLMVEDFFAPTVIHIDAHADLDAPLRPKIDTESWREYATTDTTVGSFIQPALDAEIINDCIQIRSYYALENLTSNIESSFTNFTNFTKQPIPPIILDIDLDFRAHEPSIPEYHIQTIANILRSLASSRSLVSITIATSPYFLDQQKAMRFLQQFKPLLQS